MILHKKLEADEVLEIVAMVVGNHLSEEIRDSDAEMNLTFCDDHSVEIYLMNLPDSKSPKS